MIGIMGIISPATHPTVTGPRRSKPSKAYNYKVYLWNCLTQKTSVWIIYLIICLYSHEPVL